MATVEKKKMLVIGGTGFLGRTIYDGFRKEYDIRLTCRNKNEVGKEKVQFHKDLIELDILNKDSIQKSVSEFKPDIVIHAAAISSPALAQSDIQQCVAVNIIGSDNVSRVCVEEKVPFIIGVSSVKAASPSAGIYALSKAVMEQLFCSLNKSETQFVCVRLGNIVWSDRSVFCSWQSMIENKQTVRTTGIGMSRLFMTQEHVLANLRVAINHINELQGCVMVKEMKSIRIADLMEAWQGISKFKWEKDPAGQWESPEEFLVNDSELVYTETKIIEGNRYYLIDPLKLKNESHNLMVPASTYTLNEISEFILNSPSKNT